MITIDANAIPTASIKVNNVESNTASVKLGKTLVLDGNSSIDPDGAISKNEWQLATTNSAVNATLTGTDTAIANFSTVGTDTYTVSYTVTDTKGAKSVPKVITITAD